MDYRDNTVENQHQAPHHDIEVEVFDEDVSVGRMHTRSSITTLQSELRNLTDLNGRAIVVNHIYNIHHPADRPSELHMQDVEALGEAYIGFINRRCLNICEQQPKTSSGLPGCLNANAMPCLKAVKYFEGKTGVPTCSKYIPDTKYRKCACREQMMCQDAGEAIGLEQLHGSHSAEVRRHVAVVGNLGSGKTFICQKYANLVLNRKVPQLCGIEGVHYISADDIMNSLPDKQPVRKLLFDSFIHEYVDENTRKYGYEYLCRNPDKMLFIFDGAEDLFSKFTDGVESITADDSETNLQILLQNILRGTIFRGCYTLIAVREWALKAITSDLRPQRFVLIGPMTEEQRMGLINSFPEIPKDKSALRRKFPASFHMTKDPAYLYFAASCLMSRNEHEISTDVMLVLGMLQCLIRSGNCVPEFLELFATFKKLAFCMIKDGSVGISSRCLKKHCTGIPKAQCPREIKDFMIVAPQHKQAVFHRLFDSDFCYFFPNQVFQEVLAAFYAHDMSQEDFAKFADEDLHTEKWHAVRRFVCGMVLHNEIRCHLLSNVCRNDTLHQSKLLSSLERQMKQIDSFTSSQKVELLATLHECGESVSPILEKHLRNLVLPDIAIEPSDLYALTRLGKYVKSLQKVSICFDDSITVEEYSDFLMEYVNKGENIDLNLSRLHLQPAHVDRLQAPFKSMPNTRRKPKHAVCIIVKTGTPQHLLGRFRGIKREVPQLSIDIKEVPASDNAR